MTSKMHVSTEPAKTVKNRKKPQSCRLAQVERTAKNLEEEP
jgi:hypothetical protein